MPYGLIAFDFDGTLADSFGAFVDALNAAAAKHGFHRLEGARLAQARGASARDVMRLLDVPLWKAPAITLEMRQQMRERIAQTRLFDGVADTLATLAGRGVRLAIATSNAEDNVRAVLGPATRWVHHYSCGISVFGKARKLAALTASTRVRPEDVLYVGDEMRDADAARRRHRVPGSGLGIHGARRVAATRGGAAARPAGGFAGLVAAAAALAAVRCHRCTPAPPPRSQRSGPKSSTARPPAECSAASAASTSEGSASMVSRKRPPITTF